MRQGWFGNRLDDELVTFIESVAWARGVDANELVVELMTQTLEAQIQEAEMLERCRVDEDPEDRPFLGHFGGEAGQARLLLFELNMLEHDLTKRRRKSEQAAPAEPTGA